ncbi:dnaJ homolog subfamily C member 12 [Discoglossus pictus]
MDSILHSSSETLGQDYYSLLGCDELSTVEQILVEYKVRALECHPDKHPGSQKSVEDFQNLQKAKEILTNEESRARYDYWRRSKIMIPFTQWEALQDALKMSMHWAVRNKKEPMLESSKTEIIDEKDPEMLENIPEEMDVLSPKCPEDSSDTTQGLLRFRWSGDVPSQLLRKFRNYEI